MSALPSTLLASPTYARHFEKALECVRLASQATILVQPSRDSTITKADTSPVTVADYAAQAIISYELAKAFPDIPLLAEEDTGDLREETMTSVREQVLACVNAVLPKPLSEEEMLKAIARGDDAGGRKGLFWALDPVDGTKGFLRGQQYAVCLALVRDGIVDVGVLGCPRLPVHGVTEGKGAITGCVLGAIRGAGAFQFPLDAASKEVAVQIACHKAPSTEQVRFCEGVEAAHSAHGIHEEIAGQLEITSDPVRVDSQCKYALLARGDAGIYLRIPSKPGYVEKIWDHAAGVVIVEEAGGRVTDVHGKSLDFGRGKGLAGNIGVIATEGSIHGLVLEATQQVLKKHGKME